LQLLQWRMPQPRWTLKYPNHVIGMDKILEVYPDARFVMTHRDPVQTLASIAKMSATLRSTRYESVDPKQVGTQMLNFVQRHIDRIMAFCQSPDGKLVTHVDYYRAIDNPSLVMREVHASLGIDSPPGVTNAVAEWHQRNPKNARGANSYSLDQYGLNAHAVNIPREQEGLKRVSQ
jgi:hypothetical protein